MVARRHLIQTIGLGACVIILFMGSVELLRRSKPDFVNRETEMLYPEIMSGVWVSGFEESSFFPGDTAIPDRNDPRRYRLELIPSREQLDRFRSQHPEPAYVAFRVTFLGRRTKYPVSVDCEGARSYYFVPDWILRVRYLGPMPNPDFPVPQIRTYKPFNRSGEGGVIRKLEDQALAHCGGTARS